LYLLRTTPGLKTRTDSLCFHVNLVTRNFEILLLFVDTGTPSSGITLLEPVLTNHRLLIPGLRLSGTYLHSCLFTMRCLMEHMKDLACTIGTYLSSLIVLHIKKA